MLVIKIMIRFMFMIFMLQVQGNRRVTVEAYDMGTPSLNSTVDVTIETR